VHHTSRLSPDGGFAVVQALIVFAIVAVVAALAIPAYAARAKDSVLRTNAKTLELEVKSYLAVGLEDDAATADETETGNARSAAEIIADALVRPRNGVSGYYVNPLSGSHAIVLQTALPPIAASTPPAVWITDDQGYAYSAFTASPETKSRLGGTLMIVFLTHAGHTIDLDVFYVDPAGRRSQSFGTVAI
jgi:hypothetical protein